MKRAKIESIGIETPEALTKNIIQRLGKAFDETMDLAGAGLRVRGLPAKAAESLLRDAQICFTFATTEAMLNSYSPEKRARALAQMVCRNLERQDLPAFTAEIQRLGEAASKAEAKEELEHEEGKLP